MATFTVEVWRILEMFPDDGSGDYASIGLDAYELFDPDYRKGLNQKIVDHYHNREIGQETVQMFKFAMRRKMNEIMPLYNALYESTQIEFDPFVTVDIKTVTAGDRTTAANVEGESSSTSSGKAGSRAVQSQMPQTMLAGNKDYATGATDSTSDSSNSGTGTEKSNSDTTENQEGTSETKGFQGLPADLLLAYRSTLMNVDLMIIDELKELFMNVWTTGDAYTNRKGMIY